MLTPKSRSMSVEIDNHIAVHAENTAFSTVLNMPLSAVAGRLCGILGERLAAYTAGVDSLVLPSWMVGEDLPYIVALRLRLALNAALILHYRFTDARPIIAWFTWLSNDLGGVSPAMFLRGSDDENETERRGELLISAARMRLQSRASLVMQ